MSQVRQLCEVADALEEAWVTLRPTAMPRPSTLPSFLCSRSQDMLMPPLPMHP